MFSGVYLAKYCTEKFFFFSIQTVGAHKISYTMQIYRKSLTLCDVLLVNVHHEKRRLTSCYRPAESALFPTNALHTHTLTADTRHV